MAEVHAPVARVVRLLAAVAALALLVLVVPTQPASAHVRADAESSPTRGGWGTATFQVPTESPNASTTEVVLAFDGTTTFTSVRTQPVSGWTAHLDRAGDGTVRRLVWQADNPSHAIGPDEFGSFTISAGPWPDVESVAIPVAQHYSDGSVVQWDERALDHHAELAHPAPVVTLAAAGDTDEHGNSATDEHDEVDTVAHSESHAGTGVATGIAVVALLIALVAVGYAWVVHRRLRAH
ncbi:DUF1775 domain-containing protein [Gordonia sp. CPCC 206044]|uniref:DUF1775 domain-containing protein n=1 Tax=Gordonia sp. CPCC 206044 TaxID=3140793 RepID=UPI003AF3C7AE